MPDSNKRVRMDESLVDYTSSIPNEILQHIFSFLPRGDLQKTACTCHTWSVVTVELVKRDPFYRNFRNFISNIGFVSPVYNNIIDNVVSIDFTNIRGIVDSGKRLITVKKALIRVCSVLSDVTLTRLQESLTKEACPSPLSHVFYLTIVDKNIKKALSYDSVTHKEYLAYLIVVDLLEHQLFDEAITLAKKLYRQHSLPKVLVPVYLHCFYSQNGKETEILDEIKEEDRDQFIYKVACKLAYSRNPDFILKAWTLTMDIKSDVLKSMMYQEIAMALIPIDLPKAIEVSEWVANCFNKTRSLNKISIVLAKRGELARAKEMATKACRANDQPRHFYLIARKLNKNGYIDEALSFTDEITEVEWKDLSLKRISKNLIATDVRRAEHVAARITHTLYRSCAIEKIILSLKSRGWMQEAARLNQVYQ